MLTARDIRRVRCIDGLHYSFRLLEYYHSGLWNTCCEITTDSSKAIPALAACWGFVDALHRIRELAQSAPGLSTKHQEMRAFLSATALAETYRHYIQHLRSELTAETKSFPVWGSLAWVDPENPNRSHTVLLGARLSGTQYTGCVYDTVERRWVSRVCLGVDGKSFNFDPVLAAARRFETFVLPFLVKGAEAEIQLHDNLPIISAELKIQDGA
jgi:hypothetical protein